MQWEKDYAIRSEADREFFEAARASGINVSERAFNPPALHPHEHLYLKMFKRLCTSRPYSAFGSALPIPLSEIACVAITFELPGSVEEFIVCMQRMDQFVLESCANG